MSSTSIQPSIDSAAQRLAPSTEPSAAPAPTAPPPSSRDELIRQFGQSFGPREVGAGIVNTARVIRLVGTDKDSLAIPAVVASLDVLERRGILHSTSLGSHIDAQLGPDGETAQHRRISDQYDPVSRFASWLPESVRGAGAFVLSTRTADAALDAIERLQTLPPPPIDPWAKGTPE